MKRYKWLIVLGCCFIVMALQGIVNNCYSIYIIHVTRDLQITRSAYTLTQTLHFMSCMIGAFFSWKVFERFGIIRSVRVCSIIVACLYCSYGAVTHVAGFYFRSVIIGWCVGISSTTPVTILIKQWFGGESGVAQGIAFMGSGIGSAIFLKLANFTLASSNWRSTYLVLGICVGFLSILPAFLLIKAPEQSVAVTKEDANPDRFSGAAIPSRITIVLLVCMLLSGISQGTQLYIITPYLQDIGYSATFAANVSSISFVLIAAGKVLEGMLIDKKGILAALRISYLCLILGLLSMCVMHQIWLLAVFLLCSVFSNSFPTILGPLLPLHLYNEKDKRKAVGWFNAAISCGFSLSSILPSVVYDKTGSYKPMFLVCAAACIVLMITVDSIVRCYTSKSCDKAEKIERILKKVVYFLRIN